MTLNGVMAVTLRYFTEFGKPALQVTICGGIYARVYCIFYSECTVSSQRKFTSLSHLLMSFLFKLAAINNSLLEWFAFSLLRDKMFSLAVAHIFAICNQ